MTCSYNNHRVESKALTMNATRAQDGKSQLTCTVDLMLTFTRARKGPTAEAEVQDVEMAYAERPSN